MLLAAYAPGFDALLKTAPPPAVTLAIVVLAAAVPGVLVRLLAARQAAGLSDVHGDDTHHRAGERVRQ
jgi:hypothetical protein